MSLSSMQIWKQPLTSCHELLQKLNIKDFSHPHLKASLIQSSEEELLVSHPEVFKEPSGER